MRTLSTAFVLLLFLFSITGCSQISSPTALPAGTSSPSALAASASENVRSFTVPISGVNPCNAEQVAGSLDVLLVLNRHDTGDGQTHVNVNGNFHGTLAGLQGNTYHVSGHGSADFGDVASHYDFPFHVVAATDKSAPNLTVDGIARASVDAAGNPLAATVISLTFTCT